MKNYYFKMLLFSLLSIAWPTSIGAEMACLHIEWSKPASGIKHIFRQPTKWAWLKNRPVFKKDNTSVDVGKIFLALLLLGGIVLLIANLTIGSGTGAIFGILGIFLLVFLLTRVLKHGFKQKNIPVSASPTGKLPEVQNNRGSRRNGLVVALIILSLVGLVFLLYGTAFLITAGLSAYSASLVTGVYSTTPYVVTGLILLVLAGLCIFGIVKTAKKLRRIKRGDPSPETPGTPHREPSRKMKQ